MRKIALITTAALFATAGIAAAQTQQVLPQGPKDNPRVEQIEKDKNKGNSENQNQQDIKAKEQAPATKRTN